MHKEIQPRRKEEEGRDREREREGEREMVGDDGGVKSGRNEKTADSREKEEDKTGGEM